MDLKKLEKLRDNYRQHAGSGKSSRDRNGKIISDQTRSVWFDRKTIQELLDKSDEKTGGIKIYFGEYDKETLGGIPDVKDPQDLIGRLTVILGASNNNEDTDEPVLLRNGGKMCPPNCDTDQERDT